MHHNFSAGMFEESMVPYPLTNVLIDALTDASRRRLIPHVIWVDMPLHSSLYEANEVPRYAHFLTSGIASLVITPSDGSTIEVGTLGREAIPQGVYLMSSIGMPMRCFMQTAGSALRIELSALQHVFEEDESLRQVIWPICSIRQ
jgi:hypothetical protein